MNLTNKEKFMLTKSLDAYYKALMDEKKELSKCYAFNPSYSKGFLESQAHDVSILRKKVLESIDNEEEM